MKINFSDFGMKALALASSLSPAMVFAQAAPGPIQPTSPVTSLTGVTHLLCVAIGWIFTFLLILAIIFVLVAAFRYLTSGGNEEKTKEATKALRYAAIAIVVGLLAKGIPAIIGSFFTSAGQGVPSLTTC